MKLLLLALCLLVSALFALRVVRALSRSRDGDGVWPFVERKPLTRVEQILYYRLVQTLPDQVVLAQVSLSRFLRVRKGSTWAEWHNRISQKSIDFLVCERDFSIVAAIELDDKFARQRHPHVKEDAVEGPRASAARRRGADPLAGHGAARTSATIKAVIDDIRRRPLRRRRRRSPSRSSRARASRPAASTRATTPTMFNDSETASRRSGRDRTPSRPSALDRLPLRSRRGLRDASAPASSTPTARASPVPDCVNRG